jgi:hypothetical protein
VAQRSLDNCMLFHSAALSLGLSLECVSMQSESNHGKPGEACLVR